MKNRALTLSSLILLASIGIVTTAKAESFPVKIALNKVYFLKTVGPKRKKLICFLSGNKPTLGYDPKIAGKTISYIPFRPTTTQKLMATNGIKECRVKLLSPACSDGRDNDGDGYRDYPKDLDCQSSAGSSEAPPIPTPTPSPTPAPNVSVCGDGLDNDTDGKIDYPEDPGCHSLSDGDELNQIEVVNQFSVFRKPFTGEYSVSSIFDHRYALEFIHADGSTLTHSNEETTVGMDGHQGYDYSMDQGIEILAAADGTVIFAGQETPFFCPPINQTVGGISIRIRHQVQGEQFDSLYGHLSSVSVANGQVVSKGTVIGLSGNTGCSTGPHLHFDIQRRTNTNDGNPSSIDPSGWSGAVPDPWESHAKGTQSFRLWGQGEAPAEYRFFTLPPNPGVNNSAAVAITKVRWAGVNDDLDPNNEFIEMVIDPRFYPASTYNLSGCTLRNNKNESYTFPTGFVIAAGQTIRIYSGAGVNNSTELYWGRTSGAWNNNGDCAHLIRPTGVTTYAVRYGGASCVTLGSSTTSTAIVKVEEQKEMLAPSGL